MIEMAADKETFRVPAPPPPLPKPPPKGPATCGSGDLSGKAAGRGGGGAAEGQGSRGGGDGGLSAPVSDPQRGTEASGEEGDSLAELHRPRNGFQAPQPPPQRPSKRRNSCNVGGGGFKHPAFKRRRRVNSECDPVLPSEFLLGGNIFDPLNLNSLLDEEVNRTLNAETPKSSPLPAKGRDPVEILIPKDITDPLSLNNAQEDPPVLASPAKRKRHRHRGGAQRGGSTEGGGGPKAPATPAAACQSCPKPKPCNGATPQPYELNTVINCRDEVVSPLLPAGHGEPQQSHPQVSGGGVTPSCASVASSASAGSRHHRKRRRTCSKSEGAAARHQGPPSALAEQPSRSSPERPRSAPRSRHAPPASARRQPWHKFQYGNYCKYYGYRNPDCEDARLRVMKPEWFQGKEVLDVGCNVGHFTLSVAKKWGPARMVGLDIDGHLIHSARQNIRHYLSEELHQQKQQQQSDESLSSAGARKTFPASLMASRGPIAAPRVPQEGTDASMFPNNVIFIKGNYVLERDELLEAQRPEYDVILCLSLTKWVHLNWGDEGLKRLFKRIYRHLRPGGILVLEPQAWSSYKKRKNLTETISRHFNRIKLKPDQFPSYLTSSEVGFCSYELVAMPRNTPKGFQRPIYLFHKTRPGGH